VTAVPKDIVSESPSDTFAAGERLAASLGKGDIVALIGELGAGKTVFVRGVCRGAGVEDEVTSPSFTLIQEYRGRIPVFHADFYRLDSIQEIENLGIEDYLDRGLLLVEWAEKGSALLPSDRFNVVLSRVGEAETLSENARRIRIVPPPSRTLDFA
jgi:tRNA threonylcarbamoyladenosine biosynthesis protein TsaE